MAFPTVAATNGGNVTADSTSHTVNLPGGISAGDLLIAIFAVDDTPTITWPAGWTQLAEDVGALSEVTASIYYREADGTEGASITVTTDVSEGSAHTTYRITDWHGTSAPEISAVSSDATSTPDPNSLSPSWGAEDTLWLAVVCYWPGSRTVSSYPTNYTDGINDRWSSSSGTGVGSGRRELNSSSEDPGTFTLSASARNASYVIGVRPEGAGGGDSIPYLVDLARRRFRPLLVR